MELLDVHRVGKGGNKLEERMEGLTLEEEEYLNEYVRSEESIWTTLVYQFRDDESVEIGSRRQGGPHHRSAVSQKGCDTSSQARRIVDEIGLGPRTKVTRVDETRHEGWNRHSPSRVFGALDCFGL